MKTAIRLIAVLFIASLGCPALFAEDAPKEKTYRAWWNEGFWQMPRNNPQAKALPLIQVKKNQFVNPAGEAVLFRGLSISDPDKIENQGYWSKAHFEKVKELGATVVRIPVHPVAWRERTPQKYLKLLDQAVEWCTDLEMYVIIDWHTIGNLKMELFQDPMYNTTHQETYQFWRTIAGHFRGHNTPIFYEIFNEPTIYRGQLGSMSWSEWKEMNEDIIYLIRAFDKEKIPLVAGLDWAYDLTPLHDDPLRVEGIGYVTHPYSNKRSQPWEPKWEEDFGFAANEYPVFATEFGFGMREQGEVIGDDHYGNRIVKYLESKGISWCAWVFDPEWQPRMFESWDTYKLTGSGEFFKKAMQKTLGQ